MLLTDHQLRLQRTQKALGAWYAPRTPAHKCEKRVDLHKFAANHIGRRADIRYLEFGVYTGVSMNRFSWLFSNPASRFIGFDSFEGLPEDWGGWVGMKAGHFTTGGQVPALDDTRIEFRKGWFQNSVRDFLPSLKNEPAKITLVHFDADLYSSTLFLLTSLWWHIPEYFFIFDEFFDEEVTAMMDFMSAYPVEVELYASADTKNGLPIQVFGKLRNIDMVVGKQAQGE